MNETTLAKSFQRLRIISEIKRSDGSQYQPRLHHLRHTFAVHMQLPRKRLERASARVPQTYSHTGDGKSKSSSSRRCRLVAV